MSLSLSDIKSNETKRLDAVTKLAWNHPSQPYEFYTGDYIQLVDYGGSFGISIMYNNSSSASINIVTLYIPHIYLSGQYQVITSQEFNEGVKGIVITQSSDQAPSLSNHSGALTLKREGKFTITYSAISPDGYNILNGLIEVDSKDLQGIKK